MNKLFLVAVFVGSLGQTTAFAQQEVDQRVENQDKRIEQGEKNGTLTQGQAQRLENKDQRIENKANADAAANGGKLTPAEKRRLNKRLNKNSAKIYKEKHGG